jgi:hypothetical protein
LLAIDRSTLPRGRRQANVSSDLRRLSKCRKSPSVQRMAANSGPDALEVEQHRHRRRPDGVFRGKQRIPRGLYCLGLLEQQFKPIEFAANLGLQIRQPTTIAGLEFFQSLPPIAAQRLVSGYPLADTNPLTGLTCWSAPRSAPCARGRDAGGFPPQV